MGVFHHLHLEYFPAPIPVDGVARDLVEHEERLGGLRSQYVVRRLLGDHHVLLRK